LDLQRKLADFSLQNWNFLRLFSRRCGASGSGY
jgi:hypothetical protein